MHPTFQEVQEVQTGERAGQGRGEGRLGSSASLCSCGTAEAHMYIRVYSVCVVFLQRYSIVSDHINSK